MRKSFVTRVVSLLFVLTLFILPTCAAEGVIEIEPVLLSAFDQTAAEWYESESTRAIFAATTWIDIGLADEAADIEAVSRSAILEGEVYVARDEWWLMVFFYGPEGVSVTYYSPDEDEFAVGMLDEGPRSESSIYYMEALLEEDHFTSYYEVDPEDIVTCLDYIMEILEED